MFQTTKPVAVDLYWILPGPVDFIRRIARAATDGQLLFVNLPAKTVPGTWESVSRGLRDAHIDKLNDIRITGGNDIAADIGANLGLDRISAEALAGHQAPSRTAFILRTDGTDKARENAEKFTTAFMQTNPVISGNVLLVVSISNDDLARDAQMDNVHVVAFDGGLSPDEMDAYVSLRMMDRPGPGSTRLLRSIVAEFAGFDVELAEQMLAMEEAQLLAIRDHLPEIVSQYPDRGRTSRWSERTMSLSRPDATHVFHDFYLSRHGTAVQKKLASWNIDSRYWRATVKTITPWLEERRRRVLGMLDRDLLRILKENNGFIPKATQTRMEQMKLENLEYNNIVGMVASGMITPQTAKEKAAVDVCRIVKRVRDEIAHMRPPTSSDIDEMIRRMDALI